MDSDAVNVSEIIEGVIWNAFDISGLKNYTRMIAELEEPPEWQTWGVGLSIVSACSFASPLAMLFVPLLSKSLYERAMTFLIALGIGALSGSVFFMMIPQAFNLTEFGDVFDYKVKCWILIGALYGFFAVDRLLAYIMELRRRRSAKKKIHPSTLRSIMNSPKVLRGSSNQRNATETTEISDRSDAGSYRHSERDRDSEREAREKEELKNELEVAVINNNFTRTFSSRRRMAVLRAVDRLEIKDSHGRDRGGCQDNQFLETVNSDVNQMSLPVMKFHGHENFSNGKAVEMPVIMVNDERKSEDSISFDVNVVEKRVIEPANIEIASIAYMIIFGSSANNFVDGMSMGAAFSDSLLRGLSIGLAVLSQQFPQELGTLAVLVNSGLGLKRTLMFNMIPIVLSYLGFAIGVMLDEVDEGYDDYIFAISSGMYLYIFLGTLIPEVRESTNELIKENMKESLIVTVLQIVGIACGVCFMYFMGELNNGSDVVA